MSYEMMEAMLVEGIAELRESEAGFLKSFKRPNAADLSVQHKRIQSRLNELEQLLLLMDAARIEQETVAGFIPAENVGQTNQALWA